MKRKFKELWPSWTDFAGDVIGAICLFGVVYLFFGIAYVATGQ